MNFDIHCPQMGSQRGQPNYWKSKCEERKRLGICKEECSGTIAAREMNKTLLTANVERNESDVHCVTCGDKIHDPRTYGGDIVDTCEKSKCKAERRRKQIREAKQRQREK